MGRQEDAEGRKTQNGDTEQAGSREEVKGGVEEDERRLKTALIRKTAVSFFWIGITRIAKGNKEHGETYS